MRQHVESDEPLALEADLLNDLAIDSLELVELGIKIEKAFGVKLPITELRRCVTVEEMIQLVLQTVQERELESA